MKTYHLYRLALFRKQLSALFSGRLVDDDAFMLKPLMEYVNEGLEVQHMFDTEEGVASLEAMTDANEILFSDGMIYKI